MAQTRKHTALVKEPTSKPIPVDIIRAIGAFLLITRLGDLGAEGQIHYAKAKLPGKKILSVKTSKPAARNRE